jgi:hypothetical protein
MTKKLDKEHLDAIQELRTQNLHKMLAYLDLLQLKNMQ